MDQKFDLLGDPIPTNHGSAGANGHIATAENVRKVRVLLVAGLPKKRIAEELGITMPTLTKHYFHSGKVSAKRAREFALAEQRAKVFLKLDERVTEGNVSAIKAMDAKLDEVALQMLASETQNPTPAKSKPLPKGKKEALTAEAADAIASDPLLNPGVVH